MMNDLKIYFAGSGRIAIPVLKALAAARGLTLCGVGTQPDRPVGRKHTLTPTPLGQAALELGLALHRFENINAPESLDAIRCCAPDMLVVLSYGQLLKKEILELPPKGCINIHGSLLPRWRGASPIQQALLHGDKETGIGFMRMERGLDTGAVFRSFPLTIPEECNSGELEMMLGDLAAKHAAETLLAIASGELKAVPQPEEGVTVCRKIRKEEGLIDWRRSADEIFCQVRAFDPWPGSCCTIRLNGAESVLTVSKAKVHPELSGVPGSVTGTKKQLIVCCGKNALELTEVIPAGRKAMDIASFLNGTRGEKPEFPVPEQ